jgi:hypothetical protein
MTGTHQAAPAMIEYIFFDAAFSDRFAEHARTLGLPCTQRSDNMGFVVALPEDPDEAVEDELEALYDTLQEEQAELINASEEEAFRHLAGFRLELPDGTQGMVPLAPDVANRLLAAFSLDEIHDLFALVAKHALNPQDVSLCHCDVAKD